MSLNSKKIITHFHVQLFATTSELYHTETPIKIKHTVPEISILVMLKTTKYKGNWMLLLAKINISKCWLILLDHITILNKLIYCALKHQKGLLKEEVNEINYWKGKPMQFQHFPDPSCVVCVIPLHWRNKANVWKLPLIP